ncbi:hypothetical protein NQZ68_034912 [Dissostichus eleginoides]|nr:hypothetical protein NQZ68_034912 [Dissostichus eleginoides]
MEQLNSSAVPFNISSTPGDPSPASWASIKLVSVVVVSICFLLGVPGNIAVIILKPNWQHLSSLSQSLMLNLAISDLICLLPLPLWIYTFVKGWTLGLVACKLLAYLMYCSLYSSLLTVTVLSVQRYLQVVHLQKIFDRVGKRRFLVLLWLVTMILSIPALVVRHVIKDQHGTDCHFQYSSPSQQVAVMLTETLTGFVAISVVAFSYMGLHRKVNQAAFFNNPQTTRLVTSIIVTFFVLWMPYHITNQQVCSMEEFNSSLVTFNISSTPDHPSTASWVSIRLVPAVVLSICFLLGVPGNIAVIILKPNWQHLSSLSQSLMLNLAISDLICLLPLPLWIHTFVKGWTLGLVACKLLAYLMYCSLYFSLLTVTVLSVQRYLQVVHLQKIFDRVGKRRFLVLLWLVTMILSIPALVVRHVIKDQHGTDCHFQYSSQSQQVGVMLTETLTGFVAISVVAFSYMGLHRKVNQAAFFNNPQTTRLVTKPSPTSLVSIHLVPVVVLSICFLLGVPGNIAVVILKPNWQHLSSLSQSLMLNLAISDLICLLPLPLWIYTLLYSWTLGLVACKLLTYFMFCSLYSSLLTVTLLSVQRYLQVKNLQNCLDRAGRRRLLVLFWLVTMILSIPALVIRQVIEDQHGLDCTDSHAPPSQLVAVLLSECLVGFVSISVVAFSYIGVQRKVNQAAFFNNPQTTRLITNLVAITRSGPNTHLVCQQVCNMEQLNLTFNISSPPGEPSNASWVFYLLVPVVVLFISFLLGVPGNIAVIILKPNWQHLSSLSQSLMLNLAISDLICLLSLPLWIYTLLYSWTLGLVACKILTYIMYCGVYSSMLTVTVLSVQRYLQVVNMQKIFECEGKRRLLVLLWLVTMILSIPALVVPQDTKDQYGTSCTNIDSLPSQLVAMLLTECLEGLVAISVVAFSYIGLHSKLNHAALFNNPQTTRLIISLTNPRPSRDPRLFENILQEKRDHDLISSLQEYSGPVEATLHPSSWDHKKQLHEYYIALDGELLPCKANISSTPDHPSTASWVSIRLVPALVVSICFLLGVPGNIAVIILKPNWQHLSSLSQSLMLNLAISDLI